MKTAARALAAGVSLCIADSACHASAGDPDGDAGTGLISPVAPEGHYFAKVDILVLVDNSGSMREEQIALTLRFPRLIEELIDPSDADGDTHIDHPPIEDLHVGVISPDMGTAGFVVSTCLDSDRGDDGCLLNHPAPGLGCEATYPRFLYRDPSNAASYSAAIMAQDFTCLAMLGTNGCGFERPLDAVRKALGENALPGGCNAGFLRDDSLLLVLWVTDENDCSARPEHPELYDPTRNADLGHLGIRCYLHPEMIESVESYVDALRSLRPGRPESILLAMIVGVPPAEPRCTGRGDDIGGCLSVPEMVETINPVQPTELIPSCSTSMGLAFPPERLVELAQRWGHDAYVDSICKEDWQPAIEAITRMIAERAEPYSCWPAMDFDPATCLVQGCYLIETLSDDRACLEDPSCPSAWCPPATEGDLADGTLAPCVDPSGGEECRPLKRDLGTVEVGPLRRCRRRCLTRQADRAFDAGAARCGPPANDGWYYQPPEWGAHGCAEVLFRPSGPPAIEVGSTAMFGCVPGD